MGKLQGRATGSALQCQQIQVFFSTQLGLLGNLFGYRIYCKANDTGIQCKELKSTNRDNFISQTNMEPSQSNVWVLAKASMDDMHTGSCGTIVSTYASVAYRC